jgi:hypothetical protein
VALPLNELPNAAVLLAGTAAASTGHLLEQFTECAIQAIDQCNRQILLFDSANVLSPRGFGGFVLKSGQRLGLPRNR